jgi:hypothetical protein
MLATVPAVAGAPPLVAITINIFCYNVVTITYQPARWHFV